MLGIFQRDWSEIVDQQLTISPASEASPSVEKRDAATLCASRNRLSGVEYSILILFFNHHLLKSEQLENNLVYLLYYLECELLVFDTNANITSSLKLFLDQ